MLPHNTTLHRTRGSQAQTGEELSSLELSTGLLTSQSFAVNIEFFVIKCSETQIRLGDFPAEQLENLSLGTFYDTELNSAVPGEGLF